MHTHTHTYIEAALIENNLKDVALTEDKRHTDHGEATRCKIYGSPTL